MKQLYGLAIALICFMLLYYISGVSMFALVGIALVFAVWGLYWRGFKWLVRKAVN